jgi:anti-anti-sigma regulatory factor
MVVRMTMNAEWLEIDGEHAVQGLQTARQALESSAADVTLNFASLRRIDPSALRALEELAGVADEKAVRVMLRGVNVNIYKVLKLVKLTSRFSFLT